MAGLEVGEVFAGHRIDSVVGQGGMGVVYRATQLALERPVALKVIRPEHASRPDFRARFARECRLAAQIDHPHVVPVFDAGEDGGQAYVTMRFVEGTDLAGLIDAHRGVPPGLAARLLAQVASALGAAHARGLVHRDVKPQNVLIASRQGKPHAYLTDFGLVKASEAESAMTAMGAMLGTLDYVAPEQIDNAADVDHRVDIYGLGCVLYHAVSGQLPYPRDSATKKLFAHVSAPLPSLREAVPDVPLELDGIARRAMAKRPSERFQSAADMESALLAVAEETAGSRGDGRPVPPPGDHAAGAAAMTLAASAPGTPAAAVEPARPEGTTEPARSLDAEQVIDLVRRITGHALERCGSAEGWEVLCPPIEFDERGRLSADSRRVIETYGRFRLYVLSEPHLFDRLAAVEGLPTASDPDGLRWKRQQDDPRAPEVWTAFRRRGNVVAAWQAAERGGLDETWRRLDGVLIDLW